MNDDSGILGNSPDLLRAIRVARRVAKSGIAVMLVGETGTGKELFAEAIHRWSGRPGALVDVNCGAIPKELIESVLFGHRRGTFTGAVDNSDGLVAASHSGTLFLDELTSFPTSAQVRLLRVLQDGIVRPVGEVAGVPIDLRVVSAGQANIEALRADGTFRSDLWHRLCGILIELPPLRDRGRDTWLLAKAFAAASGATLAADCVPLLLGYPWPGNVRELRTTIERAIVLADGLSLTAADIVESLERGRSGLIGVGPQIPIETDEALDLLELCRRFQGDALRIAGELGVSQATLYRRLKRFRISLRRFKAASLA